MGGVAQVPAHGFASEAGGHSTPRPISVGEPQAQQRERGVELRRENGERARHARFTAGREPIGESASDQTGVCAQRQRLDDIDATSDAAVDEHRGAAPDATRQSRAGRATSPAQSSSWRPPWLETTIASAPMASARSASSGCRTPLMTSGPRQCVAHAGDIVPACGRVEQAGDVLRDARRIPSCVPRLRNCRSAFSRCAAPMSQGSRVA